MPDRPDAIRQDLWLAQQQHLIVLDWIDRGRDPSTADIERRHGISRALIHLDATGQRWMGLAEACALEAVIALADCPLRRARRCPPSAPYLSSTAATPAVLGEQAVAGRTPEGGSAPWADVASAPTPPTSSSPRTTASVLERPLSSILGSVVVEARDDQAASGPLDRLLLVEQCRRVVGRGRCGCRVRRTEGTGCRLHDGNDPGPAGRN